MSQISRILPKSNWQKISIKENNEPIVDIQEADKLIFAGNLGLHIVSEYNMRKGVAKMLYQAAKSLPQGYVLAIVEGVRSLSKQKAHWDSKTREFHDLHPEWSTAELEYQVGLVVARPTPLANHNCGGAVDVTLMYKNEPVDMGTFPQALVEKDKVEMFSKLITKAQADNRKILRDVMENAGFVWYPGEWWHYCYGDRMWAVYSGRTECLYGPVEQ